MHLFDKHALAFGRLILVLSVLFLFADLTYHIIPATYDMPWHIDAAQTIAETGTYRTTHPGFQWLVILAHTLLPGIDYFGAGLVAILVSYLAAAWLIFELLYRTLSSLEPAKRVTLAVLITLALMLVTPVTIIRPDAARFWGYIPITVYHNPTQLAARPVMLLVFWWAVSAFDPDRRPPHLLLMILAVSFGVLTKPNYMLALLPAVFIYALIKLWFRQEVRWVWLTAGLFVPAMGVLGVQYVVTFIGDLRSSALVLAPLHVVLLYVDVIWLLPKLVLSLAFPLVVLVFYRRYAILDNGFALAWLASVAGIAQYFLLAEMNAQGDILGSANWIWGAEMALFVLFVVAARVWLKQAAPYLGRKPLRHYPPAFWLSGLVLLLHVTGGVIWFSLYAAAGAIPWGAYW